MTRRKLHLIMPMGGKGSRFSKNGFVIPKPLIEIQGKPFLYWSVRSIEKYVDLCDISFVVLKQHIEEYQIDAIIRKDFPQADIISVDFADVQDGPVMTCLAGLRNITDDNPVLFNDCDHMFRCTTFNEDANDGVFDYDGALLTFTSDQPQFSYIRYENGAIVGTVEKEVVSNHAICGAYVVKNAELFKSMAEEYYSVCSYKEFYVSGVYNVMCARGLKVKNYLTDFHVPFGTPEEYEAAKDSPYFEELK